MGLIGNLILKGVATAARNSTIKAVGEAAVSVIDAQSKNRRKKQTIVINNINDSNVYIKPTRPSEAYCGEYALNVAQELMGVGFENITFKPIHRLGARSQKRYGEVTSITINGNDSFRGVRKVSASSPIVIKYLDFKESVDPDVYEDLILISPKALSNSSSDIFEQNPAMPTMAAMEPIALIDTTGHAKRYCPYCGEPITVENARFCAGCGERL